MGAPSVPGRTARELVGAQREADVEPRAVGDQAVVLGSPYITNGAACEGRPRGGACFLSSAQRARLVQQIGLRVTEAAKNFTDAVQSVQLAQLVEKDEDASWLAGLVLDLVTVGVASKLGAALTSLHAGELQSFRRMVSDGLDDGTYDPLVGSALRSLEKVEPKSIEAAVKRAVDLVKKPGQKLLDGASNRVAMSARADRLDFFDDLRVRVQHSFMAIAEQTPAYASDAELLTLHRSLELREHTQATYRALLEQKLQRYKASGVANIGMGTGFRKDGRAVRDPGAAPFDQIVELEPVTRDTRVVWVAYAAGSPPVLHYEYRDGEAANPITEPVRILPGTAVRRTEFGPDHALTAAPQLGDAVPQEFVETALARHAQRWGTPVQTLRRGPSWWFAGSPPVAAPSSAGAARASTALAPDALVPQRDVVVPDELRLAP